MINKFPEGDKITEKLHNTVKKKSSTNANRKNYDSVLEKHSCLPTKKLEQDYDGARIVAGCKLLKSSLRIKRGTLVCCQQFDTPNFLTEDELKTVGDLKPFLVMHHD